ncbi:MAG TPA: hypothetical protein VKG21_14295 [Casimicrobiaceae bacterium]|nr:hypothetical protein [Casimicrobiaceae bacterium]
MIGRQRHRPGNRTTSLLGLLALGISCAHAQLVVHSDENLDSSRTEAWAMNYVGAATFMTAFGETPALKAWSWGLAVDAGYIPKLTAAQQRVGLHGIKQEDLNRSQVFGRLRVLLGLPGDFVATVGYTPPITIDGVQALDLFSFAIARRLLEHDDLSLSMQIFGQHGRLQGDITCPKRLSDITDITLNPFGCRGPSNDHVYLNYYGLEAVGAWTIRSWHPYVSGGVVRTEFQVRVDAMTFDVHDRSHLTARGSLPFGTVGTTVDLDPHWSLGAEVLYVPLNVQRRPNMPSQNDQLTSARIQLLYRFD